MDPEGRSTGGSHHELRTQLGTIIGFTDALLMQLAGPLNAEQERQLRLVQASGHQALALIEALLHAGPD